MPQSASPATSWPDVFGGPALTAPVDEPLAEDPPFGGACTIITRSVVHAPIARATAATESQRLIESSFALLKTRGRARSYSALKSPLSFGAPPAFDGPPLN